MTAYYDERGDLLKITCNGCDKVIGEEVIVVRGDKEAWMFRRNDQYIEAKIALEANPPHFFVANGCRDCLRPDTSADILTKWVQKDMTEQMQRKVGDVKALRVVQLGIGIP